MSAALRVSAGRPSSNLYIPTNRCARLLHYRAAPHLLHLLLHVCCRGRHHAAVVHRSRGRPAHTGGGGGAAGVSISASRASRWPGPGAGGQGAGPGGSGCESNRSSVEPTPTARGCAHFKGAERGPCRGAAAPTCRSRWPCGAPCRPASRRRRPWRSAAAPCARRARGRGVGRRRRSVAAARASSSIPHGARTPPAAPDVSARWQIAGPRLWRLLRAARPALTCWA